MRLSDLKQPLLNTLKHLRRAAENSRTGKGNDTLPNLLEAYENARLAQRNQAAAMGEEYAIPFDIGCLPHADVPSVVILQTDVSTVLTFNAHYTSPEGIDVSNKRAVVELGCCLTKFGHPNDEALPGHPLYQKGLNTYGVYEVINSSWVRQVKEMNSVSFPDRSDWIDSMRHYIFVFHEDVFECIGGKIRVSMSLEPTEKIFEEVIQRDIELD